MKSRPLNFSLAGLITAIMFFPSVALVWKYRSPWSEDQSQAHRSIRLLSLSAPDGRRQCRPKIYGLTQGVAEVHILDVTTSPPVELHVLEMWFANANEDIIMGFVDDAAFAAQYMVNGVTVQKVFRRRFPEWWWGHFYRPEVWIAILFGSLWLYRTFHWFCARRGESEPRP